MLKHPFLAVALLCFGLAFVATLFGLVTGCAHLTAQDKTDLAEYEAEQSACIAANPGNKAAIDACRAAAKKAWCDKWASEFDAAVCQ